MGYEPPVVEEGRIVNWYHGGNTSGRPHAAIVSRVNHGGMSLNLDVFSPDNHNLLLRDCVRHVSDPNVNDHDRGASGLWDFTARDKKIDKLLKDFGAEEK